MLLQKLGCFGESKSNLLGQIDVSLSTLVLTVELVQIVTRLLVQPSLVHHSVMNSSIRILHEYLLQVQHANSVHVAHHNQYLVLNSGCCVVPC